MSLTDEDIEKVGHASVLELTKDIWIWIAENVVLRVCIIIPWFFKLK